MKRRTLVKRFGAALLALVMCAGLGYSDFYLDMVKSPNALNQFSVA